MPFYKLLLTMAWGKSKGRYKVVPKTQRTKDGIVYDSKHEMLYSMHLDLLMKSGEVKSYERQVPYLLEVNGHKIAKYILDYKVYYTNGTIEHIDCKASKTLVEAVYKLKKKLMLAIHGIEIKEVYMK